ncbi:MAG TPA: cupin domain-containing protein [Gemmatimonadales bacterium]|nr:cupin domain-containing protein [Gemmatimonadales bacterium]
MIKALSVFFACMCLSVFGSAASTERTVVRMEGLNAKQQRSATIRISNDSSRPAYTAPGEYFTGSVVVRPLFQASTTSRVSGASVTFEPGARTAWHDHPLGQVLIVSAGTGWVQQWGGAVQVIRPGDVVSIPPGVKHWHGGTATTGMTHIAIQEQRDGKSVQWMEKVSDEQYRAFEQRGRHR